MPCSVPTAIPRRKSFGPNLRRNHHSTPPGGSDPRDRFADIKTGPRTREPIALFAPARKYELDLARALVHEGDLLLDDDKAEAAQLRRQSLRFGGQRMKFDVGGDNAIDRNRKAAACERRRLPRDQLRDLYLLIHREMSGLRGGGLGRRLRRSRRSGKA